MKRLEIKTTARNQMVDIRPEVEAALAEILAENGSTEGALLVYCPHTTGAITVNEDYDPDVKRDILYKLEKDIPKTEGYHHAEGNSDSHVKSSLVGTSETLIVSGGKIQLGRWQGLLFCEFDGPRTREVWVQFLRG